MREISSLAFGATLGGDPTFTVSNQCTVARRRAPVCSGTCLVPRPSTFEGSLQVSARVGTVYRVNLNASVALTSFSGSGFAIADPYIHVDPSFAQAGNYSIEVSPGVANAIPEPATLVLLGSAVAGLAWRRRRDRSAFSR